MTVTRNARIPPRGGRTNNVKVLTTTATQSRTDKNDDKVPNRKDKKKNA